MASGILDDRRASPGRKRGNVHRALVLALVAALLLVPAAFAAEGEPTVQWTPRSVDVLVGAGVSVEIATRLEVGAAIEDAWIDQTPSLDGVLTASELPPESLAPGSSDVHLRIEVPDTAAPGTEFEGTLRLRSGRRTVARPLPVQIAVTGDERAVVNFDGELGTTTTLPSGVEIKVWPIAAGGDLTLTATDVPDVDDFALNGRATIHTAVDVQLIEAVAGSPPVPHPTVTLAFPRNHAGEPLILRKVDDTWQELEEPLSVTEDHVSVELDALSQYAYATMIDPSPDEPTAPMFVTTWDTELIAGTTISLPFQGEVDVDIDWGDGTLDAGVTSGPVSHTFGEEGNYTVKVTGTFSDYGFPSVPGPDSSHALLSVDVWEETETTSLQGAFRSASNLTSVAEPPSSVIDMSAMFFDATSFDQPIGDWNVGNVTDMSAMFFGASSFSQPIGDWDVSNVTQMDAMFAFSTFDQPIGDWNVGNVTSMGSMFFNAGSFSQPIGDWDVSNVASMAFMFEAARSFNQPIGEWDVSNVTDMSSMFRLATSFDQPIGGWDVGNVTHMRGMFMSDLFADASSFNQSLSDWDVSNVTHMDFMFFGADTFNQPLSDWDVSNVTHMDFMFAETQVFNQDLSGWNVSNVISHTSFCEGADAWQKDFKPRFPLVDDFEGEMLDETRWDIIADVDAEVWVESGELNIHAQGGLGAAGVVSTSMVAGDFDVRVDYRLVDWPQDNRWYSARAGPMDLDPHPDAGTLGILRSYAQTHPDAPGQPDPLDHIEQVYVLVSQDGQDSVTTDDMSGSLRMLRCDDRVWGFVSDEQGAWQSVGEGSIGAEDTRIYLLLAGSSFGDEEPPGAHIVFSNFRTDTTESDCPTTDP